MLPFPETLTGAVFTSEYREKRRSVAVYAGGVSLQRIHLLWARSKWSNQVAATYPQGS
jgi:hypothetical protein